MRRHVRRGRAAGLGALLVAVLLGTGVAPAAAVGVETGPLLDPDAAEELVVALAEARDEQGVCYGWEVDVSDASGSWTGVYVGSDEGVGVPVDTTCDEWVLLSVAVNYTSYSSESEDSAAWAVITPPGLTGVETDDVERLGLSSSALVDDARAEDVLVSAVSALPVLVAEAGVAPPVPFETSDEPLPAGAAPDDGGGGSDWLRARGAELVLLVLVALGGVVTFVLSFPGPRSAARGLVDAVSSH